MDTDFLDWAFADFSGYVAADELYDGPFCMLSAVDNRRYKRLLYDVLDHDPTHEDIRVFLGRLKTALTARALTLLGITTDGSALYPVPLAEVFGGVRHQLCAFHIVAEVNKAVLGAVASARKSLAAKQPKLRRGRPSTPAATRAARTKKRRAAQSAGIVVFIGTGFGSRWRRHPGRRLAAKDDGDRASALRLPILAGDLLAVFVIDDP